MNSHDQRFMQHALELARAGVGLASPNPTVGCVLVKDGAIVGEGFHDYDKRDHAEIVALRQAGKRAIGATAYVTLEPCDHTGRTGPCSEALVTAGVSRVVAAMEDPNPRTHGAGFARLRSAGIEVQTGMLEPEAQRINEGFARWIITKKPFVTLKSAVTLDGQLALPARRRGKKRAWITGEESRAEVQRMRHASDALLTGIGTILADDPLLTDRSGLRRRRKLLRIVLDSKLRLSPTSRIVKSAAGDLLVFTGMSPDSPKARRLQRAGVEVLQANMRKGKIDVGPVMRDLGRRDILSVLVEAGPSVNAAVLSAGIVDRMTLFFAPKIAGDARLPLVRGTFDLDAMHISSVRQFGADVAFEIYMRAGLA